jgi:hypothetical protein
MFRTVSLSIIRSFSLFTQQWYMVYRFADSLLAGTAVPSWSCYQAVWHIQLLCVQWKSPDDGQRNCPKHVEFHSKNKFEKFVHPVCFIIRNLLRILMLFTAVFCFTWSLLTSVTRTHSYFSRLCHRTAWCMSTVHDYWLCFVTWSVY